MGLNQVYLMISLAAVLAAFLLSLRILRIFRLRGEIRKAIRVTRECFKDIESQADHLRMRRGHTLRGDLPYPTANTGWESEKKKFISIHLVPILKQIRSESHRATAIEQCAKFIEFIASSPVADQYGAVSEKSAVKVLAPL